MSIYDIVCGECDSHDFVSIDGKYTCKGCGYKLTGSDFDNLLGQCYRDYLEGKKVDTK